jgi:hypothetical protein
MAIMHKTMFGGSFPNTGVIGAARASGEELFFRATGTNSPLANLISRPAHPLRRGRGRGRASIFIGSEYRGGSAVSDRFHHPIPFAESVSDAPVLIWRASRCRDRGMTMTVVP